MTEKGDKGQLVPPEGASGDDLQDPPPQYEAGGYATPSSAAQPATGYGYNQPATGYGYNQQGTGYGFDQPAMGYNQPVRPAVNYGYDQPAAGYARQPVVQQPVAQQQTTVVMSPSNQTVIVQSAVRPPNYMWLSCLVYWLCNCICGGIAIAFSMASSSAADDGRMEEARTQGKAALNTSIIGIFFGIMGIIFLVLYWSGALLSSDQDDDYKHNYYG